VLRYIATALALSAPAAAADAPLRFQFRAGDSLTYTVAQTTAVAETTLDDKTSAPVTATSSTTLALTRRWDVKAVDAAGVATLELAITAMKQEIVRPGPADRAGKPTEDRIVIDSATDEGRKQLAAYLNKPVLRMKVDPLGRPADVTALIGPADRAKAELPFRVLLPDAAPAVGATWDRPAFALKLDPPFGTGESFDASQTFTLKSAADGAAVIALSTSLKSPPTDPAQMPALVPLLWDGEAKFDATTGRYSGAKLRVKREVANHQGTGTKFVYESELTETLVK
jgi:hypothetical protein